MRGFVRYDFDRVLGFLQAGECARREGWSLKDVICMKDGKIICLGTGKPVQLADAEREAKDWLIYRTA